MVGLDVVTRNDADLLVVLVGTSCTMLLGVLQAVEEKFLSLIDQSSLWEDLRRILRSTQCIAAVVPATTREGIVSALELASHLLVGRAAPRHQHHMKACKSEDGNGEDRNERHETDGDDWLGLAQLVLAVHHVE